MQNIESGVYGRLTEQIRLAMVSGDAVRRDCLRYAVSEIKNRTVNEGKPVTDEVCLAVVRKLVKQHDDSIRQFSSCGRTDLAEKEEAEKAHLSEFLPRQLSEHETNVYIERVVADNGIEKTRKNMGAVMKLLAENPSVDRGLAARYLREIMR